MAKSVSHSFLQADEGFGSAKHGISCSAPEKISSSWQDSVGDNITKDFNYRFEKLCETLLDTFSELKKVDEAIPSIKANDKYQRQIFKIEMLRAD